MVHSSRLLCAVRRTTVFCVAAIVFTGLQTGSAVMAQNAPSLQNMLNGNMSSSQLMQLQQMRQNSGSSNNGSELTPQQMVLVPVDPQKPKEFSTLEKIISERAGISLEQYGYDQFGTARPVTVSQVGGVQDNYVLGTGDEVVVSLRGQENGEYRLSVDRDGRVVLPRIAPVSAGGRNFGEFKKDLIAAIRRAYVSTDAYISLGQVRQVSVTVSGEVNNPGVRTLNGLSTVADAIALSGGVMKSGSLRAVLVKRGSRVLTVDLYGVLSEHAHLRDYGLADGDRIIVPTVGATIAIAGDVRHAGIFELPSHRAAISVREALSLANRTVVPGVYRLSLLRQMPDGRRKLVDVSGQKGGEIRDGEILIVKMSVDAAVGQVELKGAARSDGYFALDRYKTLHDLFKDSEAFEKDAYMLFGYVDRLDPQTHMHSVVPFSPKRIVDKTQNVSLMSNDVVHVITKKEMDTLLRWAMQEQKRKNPLQKDILKQKNQNGDNSSESSNENSRSSVPGTGMRKNMNNNDSRNTVQDNPYGNSLQDNFTSQSDPAVIGQNTVPYGAMQNDPRMMQGGAQSQQSEMRNYNPMMQQNGSDIQNQPFAQNAPQYPQGQPMYGVQQYGQTMPFGQKPDVLSEVNNQKNAQIKLADLVPRDAEYLRDIIAYYTVNIAGAVNAPGSYLIAPGTSLNEALAAAGGMKPDADLSNVEVTSSKMDVYTGASATERQSHSVASAGAGDAITILPRDAILVRSVYTNRTTGTVTISGQVRYPGTYSLLRGDRLSSILKRAGGLTDIAYPEGTVFLRDSITDLERKANQRAAKQIEDQLLTAMNRRTKDSQMSAEAFTAMQDYVHELETSPVLGRMVVMADPAVLAMHPEEDPLLETNDKIVIPSKPFSVSVMGEVIQPNSVPYKPNLTPRDYIDMAGGFSQSAEEDEIFVVLPNGKAYRDETSWFSFGSRDIPAGSMVYVGRDISGYDLRQGFIDVASIVSSFATTAASMAVLIKEAN